MTRLSLTLQSKADLNEIRRYIAQDNPKAALQTLQMLRQKMTALATQPHSGRLRDDLAAAVRSFPIDPYVIFYRPISDGIEVLRVLHTRRDHPAVFQSGKGS